MGDLQGCCNALARLLGKLDLTSESPLWFVGDLVNRGPSSLATLHKLIQLGQQATSILGNHDLHLLAIFAGSRKQKPGDTLDEILQAPDAVELIDWLRNRPLAHFDGIRLMVHAGVLPQWDVANTLELAGEIEAQLRAPTWRSFTGELFAAPAQPWHPRLKGIERMRSVTSVLTRIRLCDAAGQMETRYSGPPASAPAGFMPWFDVPDRKTDDVIVVFGHWAALGLVLRDRLCALDTGCVWGNQLSAVPLDIDPQKRIPIQVDCRKKELEGDERSAVSLNAP
ncbi:symmetrical bis(5'-nucleosyl)-tetraphosphatase [Burkholderia sp. L27(2015)]|uniref:symmetrical bis(5'-nucleosyl)-tetraphosphatase n=1 Tax=Burkholderia sp. L27(2015) TaxID=1641858 RepID=UPI0020B1443D|nr:symmetrical bis(5'-nucleosyl)-tetraphosphatase [Burkholderia sp. L27(2015)]